MQLVNGGQYLVEVVINLSFAVLYNLLKVVSTW
jgi:hypothetical protein